ncbi:MAG: prepilin-type N-terminal cleavage/methylation domain-containing protein [Tepidisphaeraceae bacterium]
MRNRNLHRAGIGFRVSGFGSRVKRQNAPATLFTRNPIPETRNPKSRGFTLVEMMVVVSIIIVLTSLAIPVVHALNGNNSLAAGSNRISAMLSVARSDAIINRQITGVFFYIDPVTQQVAMAEVMPNQVYPVSAGASVTAGTALVQQLTYANAASGTTATVPALELVYSWQMYPTATAGAGAVAMTKYYYRDVELLPKGVGVALCNNSVFLPSPEPQEDRYMRLGAIMFNTDGTLLQMSYGIAGGSNNKNPYSSVGATRGASESPQSELGVTKLLLRSDITTDSNYYPPLTSEAGLVLYDRDAFAAQTTNVNAPYIPGDGQAFNDLDLEYYNMAGVCQTYLNDKRQEEAWIDQNGVAYLVSPFNGDLVKSK